MILVIVVRDFGMTALRSIAISKGKPLQTSQLAKLKTFLQMVFIVYVLTMMLFTSTDILPFAKPLSQQLISSQITWYFALGITILTVVSAIEYFYKNRK